ncbi:UNVERIFIED_CONTAM: ribose 5-phosphate isomerase B [Acetivibrio alkalicellulosi]
MKVGIGSDHAGYNLKKEIIKYFEEKNIQTIDFGTCSNDSVDYPDYGLAVAEAVKEGKCDRGIIICGTGLGISIAANKVKGIRAANCTNSFMARMSREHNDCNVLAIGERVVGLDLALDIVDTWMNSEFQGGKHKRRVDKICEIERKYCK